MQRFQYFGLVISLVFAILITYCSYSQDVDLDPYYYSSYQPEELNRKTADQMKALYEDYVLHYGLEAKKVSEKEFFFKYNYFNDRLNRSGNVFYGDSISSYLNDLKEQILYGQQFQFEIKVYLTDFASFNAFTNDFGSIYVHIGAFARINSEEELMYLLAHEIAHVLLRHSHKTEIKQKEWQSTEIENEYDRHLYSRENELEADSLAFELLKTKVDPKHLINLFEALRNSNSPIYPGKVNFSLLTSSNLQRLYLDSLWNSMEGDTLFYPIDDNDSLSTHPSIDERLQQIIALSSNLNYDYPTLISNRFSQFRLEAQFLLVNSLIKSKDFITALELIIKLRMQNQSLENNIYLIENQAKVLTSVCQLKYRDNILDQVLSIYGNTCKDEDFLRFRKIILSLSNVDLNILSCLFTREQNDQFAHNEIVQYTAHKNIQFLYAENKSLFVKDSSNVFKIVDQVPSQLSAIIVDTSGAYFKEKFKEIDIQITLKNSENKFIHSFINNPQQWTYLDSCIKSYNSLVSDTTANNSIRDYEILIHPAIALKQFRRGKFYKSPDFNPKGKTILFESQNLFFNSRRRMNFTVNYVKTVKLESLMNNLREASKYHKDLSMTSASTFTVKDNYFKKITDSWVESRTNADIVQYSNYDKEVMNYFSQFHCDYLVYTLCVVNRNLGAGKRNYLNYYEVYIDLRNGSTVYLSQIASGERPSKFQLENLIYLSDIHKSSELK